MMKSRTPVLGLVVAAALVATPVAAALVATPVAAAPADGHPMDHGAMNHGEMTDMDHGNMDHMNMEGMDHAGMAMPGMKMTGLLGGYSISREASGTSWQPEAAGHRGLHGMAGDWMLMGHARLSGIYDYQSGPRGDEMPFLAGMLMGMAQRNFAEDTLGFRAMLSPDPLMGRRGYPLLLASGETADGATHLVDRQHPHDLVMELAGSWSHRIGEGSAAFLYLGYPGEPALGPAAFMHRASAMDNPSAPISHHWLDSTHIAFGVATAGLVLDDWKLEASQFTGREPDQRRFGFDHPRMDSTSARVTFNPDEHWSLQASWGHLNSPEQLEPLEDETRYTASASYFTALGQESSAAATFAWGLKSISGGARLNALLAEAEYKPAELWTVFARAEWEENAELAAGRIVQAGEVSLGLVRDFKLSDHWKFGLGGLYAFDITPGHAGYGNAPHGAMAFVRLIAE